VYNRHIRTKERSRILGILSHGATAPLTF
jgi:hypothetical protein